MSIEPSYMEVSLMAQSFAARLSDGDLHGAKAAVVVVKDKDGQLRMFGWGDEAGPGYAEDLLLDGLRYLEGD